MCIISQFFVIKCYSTSIDMKELYICNINCCTLRYRQNARHFTAVHNNGVTRSENLTGLMSFADGYMWEGGGPGGVPGAGGLPDALVDEVQRMANGREDLAGLEECFKKVCKVRHTQFPQTLQIPPLPVISFSPYNKLITNCKSTFI